MTNEFHNPLVAEPDAASDPTSVTESPEINPGAEATSFSSEALPIAEVASLDVRPDKFSVSAIKKYSNPVNAAKAYGRFVKRTVKNFGLSEVNGTVGALGAAYLSNKYGGSLWATAWAGSLGEDVGFYGTVATQKYRELRRKEDDPYTRRETLREVSRYMVGSFAIAEMVDKPVRPALMWGSIQAFEHSPVDIGSTLAVGVGKIAADHVFYGIVDPSVSAYKKRAEKRLAQKQAREARSPKV